MQTVMSKKSLFRWGGVFLIALMGGTLVWWYCADMQQGPVYTFKPSRDLKQMVELFEKNRNWLTYQKYSDPAFLFVNKTPSYRDARLMGRMETQVLRDGGNLIGYACYYIDLENKGKILFVVVDEKYRGKRYAQQLVNLALEYFKKHRVSYVYLATRLDNVRARSAYTRMGFFETERDDTYITYGYQVR
jgi:ribosomal protein S18 acetylase RimI-like enzyme